MDITPFRESSRIELTEDYEWGVTVSIETTEIARSRSYKLIERMFDMRENPDRVSKIFGENLTSD